MPSPFSTQLDLKLIKLVKENPVIYNPRHPKYSDCDTRELTWQKISDTLGRPTAEFAGIQCQIQFGDYNEEKHKPGFIENFAEYLPEQYCSSWGIEKKILKEYAKHVGVNELHAKHLYTKTARELPTYGVTFFLVKEKQKGKKKLVPRLLGISSDAILRLDETTKEILQQWPLTHVKTYHAGRGETFTLNFGDYTDKEYSVKTRDAFRIREILEGYIDLIRKRMLAKYNTASNDQGCLEQDNVSSGQASMVQHISNNPMKIVERSFVGPSKIVQYEPGQKVSQQSQMVTTYQVVMSDLANKQGHGVKGEVPLRSDMSRPFTTKLNRMNSNSVKIVTLLTEPSQGNLEQTKKIVDSMNADMPLIRDGVKDTVDKQTSDEEKKKLRDQLQELEELMKTLTDSTTDGSENPTEADDAAKQIADLTTRMYFSMNPETKRRSGLLRRSQSSFIADEKVEKTLRRASFIAATASANHALDNAEELVGQEYSGSPLNAQQVEQLEKSALDRIGKLNAAIAHFLLAHSDPQNIDYGAAVNSLNTIHELMPELAKDGQKLSSVKDGKDRRALRAHIRELCRAAKGVCSLSGVQDAQKLQEASDKYTDVARKLVFTFGDGSKPRADKEREVVGLAEAAAAVASELVARAQRLAAEEDTEVRAAGAQTAAAARDLLAQAKLNAPTIHEAHCRSAVTAAAEAVAAAAHRLAGAWRPLLDRPSGQRAGEDLHAGTMDLAQALDRLTNSYDNLGDVQDVGESPKSEDEMLRLKFVKTVSKMKGSMQAAEADLSAPILYHVNEKETKEAQARLPRTLGQLNAAIASLLAATADREKPDYAAAEEAVKIISELMPEVVKDAKSASASEDERSRAALLENVRGLCDVTGTLCAAATARHDHSQGLSDAVDKFTDASGKLTYVVNKRADPARESQIVEQAAGACSQGGALLAAVQRLAEAEGGRRGEELDARGAGLADAAQTMLAVAQLTAPSISDPRCQSTLLAAIDKVSSSAKLLENSWTPLQEDPKYKTDVLALKGALDQLEAHLDRLRASCQLPDNEVQSSVECQISEVVYIQDPMQKQKRLHFIKTMDVAKEKLAKAQNELHKPAVAAKGAGAGAGAGGGAAPALAGRLAELSAALAALLAATADRENPDYVAAEKAATTITELMPHVIQDTKTVSAGKDESSRAAMLAHIQELCDASQRVCASSYGADPQDMNEAVSKFADASGKLVYVVSPKANPKREEQILDLTSAACREASQLLSGVQQLAEQVGGARGEELDKRGGRVADAAQGLLQVAQLTAPAISSPHCSGALLSAADQLSSSGRELAGSLRALPDAPPHRQHLNQLQQAHQRLEDHLLRLRQACNASDVGGAQSPDREQHKLHFIETLQKTNGKLADANKELSKPTKPAKGADVSKVQDRLAQRLAELNGSVAALLAATADREKPDYVRAEKAASNIAELMPNLIQDTKTVSAGKDESSRAAMLAHIQELCDASQRVCASSYGADPQDMNEAVSKFADASGKLVYVVSPKANPKREEQILDLTSAACREASQLLSGVQQLAEQVGGTRGEELDKRGGRVADAAQGLLQVAQLTAPAISSPHCSGALLSAADQLSSSGRELAGSLRALSDAPPHRQHLHQLQQAHQRLEDHLLRLRQACDASDVGGAQSPDREQHKLHFIETLQKTNGKLADANKELSKPTKPAKGADVSKVQDRLAHRLAELNGSVAALLAATADREKPDYVGAEKAASNIAELMPNLIQDTKTVSAGKDESSRAAMLAHIQELCDASQRVCASSYGANPQDINEAVSKFADASGKLVYVVSPKANPKREEQILDLTSAACREASQLLSGVQQLAEQVGGTRGEELDKRGGRVADAAQGLLQVAQLTAPAISSPHCSGALLSAADQLSSSGRELAGSLRALSDAPPHRQHLNQLQLAHQRLEDHLDKLKASCQTTTSGSKDPNIEQQKNQFIKTLQATEGKWSAAQKELLKPTAPAKGGDVTEVQHRLSQGLGRLNASIAALLAATGDRENPRYSEAETLVNNIADLLPQVIQDTKTVSANKDDASRTAMLDQLKDLCDASQRVCASSYGTNVQDMNEAVSKFADASGKLVYVVSPKANPKREEQIVDLSAAACGETSLILSSVQQLAEGLGGTRGEEIDAQGGRVADAAQEVLRVAQITASSISSPECQKSLLTSVHKLADTSAQLAVSLEPLTAEPQRGPQARNLLQALEALQAQLDKLKKACSLPDKPSPDSPNKPSPLAHAGSKTQQTIDATQDFLNTLRCEAGTAEANPTQSPPPLTAATKTSNSGQMKVKPPPPVRITDDEKRLHQQFVTSVDDAEKSIKQHESSLMKLCRSEAGTGPALSQSDMMQKQEALQRNLALAGVQVANLAAANYADKIDYTAASKSTKALPQLMTDIVEDGKQMSENVNAMARKAFLYDMVQLCGAGGAVCRAARADRQKLNEAAVHFGDTYTKLLYVVSSDVDPGLEKEIISRAKAIGDSASRLASDAAGIATAASGTGGSSVEDICDAGTACVDAAAKVVYTAKLTAPSIHEAPCQEALVSSTEHLSTKLKAFSDSWKPLSSDPHQAKTIRDLTKEADNLERILDGLRGDVKGGNIGRRREMEHLLIEETPLRQLTVKILDDAKVYAESPELSPSRKLDYAAYADRLTAALAALDLANARCKKAPHDTNKRRELENAIQDLQVILLQSRPNRGDKGKSNIVDLRDFIEEVSAEAKEMSTAASSLRAPTPQDNRTLEEVEQLCAAIVTKADKLMNVESRTDLDTTFDDVLGVEEFGQECDAIINKISSELRVMEDVKAKRLLLSKVLALGESCNLLQFATKSAISTEASASLDSSLDALDDIEARVITSVVQNANPDGVAIRLDRPVTGHSSAAIALCREVASAAGGVSPPPVTAYIADAALRTDTADPHEKNKLLKHLYKLVHLLKTLTVTSSKRSACWQPPHGPEVATLTEQILMEVYSPESAWAAAARPGDAHTQVVDGRDIAKLLIPSAPKILGDKMLQEQKLVQLAAQLSSMSGALSLAVTSPALSRSVHAAADAALELDAIARGCNTQNHMDKKRVDDAAKEMSFATYTVLKIAESASHDPTNPNTKRRLADACENLNRCINTLVSASSSGGALKQRCGALSRDVTLRLAALQPAPSALPFQHSSDVLEHQKENIYKLKNDQPLARKEFMRHLDDVGRAVNTSTECASHCAYYIGISESDKDAARTGVVDVPQIQKCIEHIQDSCMAIIGASSIYQAAEKKEELHKRVEDLSGALDKAQVMVNDGEVKRQLARAKSCVAEAAEQLEVDLKDTGDMSKVTPKAVTLLEAVNRSHSLIEQCPLVPALGDMTKDTKANCDAVLDHSKTLLSNTLALLKDVNAAPEEPETLTWVSFNTSRKKLLEAYDALVKSVKKNGHRAGILENAPEEEKEEVKKSYVELQVELANKWLKSASCKSEVKAMGQQAARNVVDMAAQMSDELKGNEREEIRSTITETEELLSECGKKYDHEKNSVLMDRLKELKKSIQRGVVTRVVEDFIEAEEPFADLEILTDSENDESKRHYILERKIASLLAQLGRVTRTARFVAGASQHQQIGAELTQCSEQTELLAPMLVQAAQQRIEHPDDKVVVEKYKSLLAKYAESISKVRDLCDRAVDPMDFVQAAGDTMQRMREDLQHNSDPQKCAYTSTAITKLANRVIHVSMSSHAVQNDPELRRALVAARERLRNVTPAPDTRASRLPDWRECTAEILRTTGDVESALGGENIFKNQPTIANQSIYVAARDMHESVRSWSARDNEIVAGARRMAVLMARLSEHMETDRKNSLISTSKSIVLESQEVAQLAKKLAHECTDVRIKKNLLQTCERIPTISGQLKMLTTVKGSSLGHHGSEEDKEAMDMLVGNAQSLMLSIQDVVKAAASASVKIMSQRGPRLRWVQKNYY